MAREGRPHRGPKAENGRGLGPWRLRSKKMGAYYPHKISTLYVHIKFNCNCSNNVNCCNLLLCTGHRSAQHSVQNRNHYC